MSLKRSSSPPSSSPRKRVTPETFTESTHYYITCQFRDPHGKPRTKITRCYTTAPEAFRFVGDLVRSWEPDIERQWEEFGDDDGDDNKDSALLLQVTAQCSSPRLLLGVDVPCAGEVVLSVQREKVPIYKPPPPPPIRIGMVYVVVQKDFGKGGVVSTLRAAFAERKEANCEARKVLRLVGGGLDRVGRINCRHEESMDEEGLYVGCAYVEDGEREKVEVVVERLDIK